LFFIILYKLMKRRRNIVAGIIGLAVLVALAAADLLCGGAADSQVLRLLRAPRVATALLAGAALALSGTQMQSIFRNPLADPHIMGVSAGASLGAAIATMSAISHSGGLSIALAASVGAMASALIILLASKKFHSASTLLIFGIMLGFIVNALVAILQFSTDAESLKLFYSWSAGSFSTTTWSDIITLTIAVLIGTALAIAGRKGLDIILFGDEFALMAGAKVGNIRLTALLSCCIMTGAVTAFCGPLGFVGITAPHIARWMFGTSSHKVIIPASILTGGIISIAADLISQLSPSPLPTASTMALVGIPVILYILIGKPSFGK
jgi:iron complex transport system permease protein